MAGANYILKKLGSATQRKKVLELQEGAEEVDKQEPIPEASLSPDDTAKPNYADALRASLQPDKKNLKDLPS